MSKSQSSGHASSPLAQTAELWRLGGLSPWELLVQTVRGYRRNHFDARSAQFAYYSLLSLFPLLILLIAALAQLPLQGILDNLLDAIDHAVEPSLRIEKYFDDHRPDLVIITPLVGVVASSQLDVLRSAQARGIPTAVCVWSWDHLSSKAIIRDLPDRLFVWNNVQREEATTMHGVPGDRVVMSQIANPRDGMQIVEAAQQ